MVSPRAWVHACDCIAEYIVIYTEAPVPALCPVEASAADWMIDARSLDATIVIITQKTYRLQSLLHSAFFVSAALVFSF